VIVFLAVKEPRRGALDRAVNAPDTAKAGFWATFRMFFSRPVLVLAAIGGGATQFITYGLGNFTVLFLQREKGMSLDDVAIYYALVVGIAMSAGIFISGRLIDRFTRRSKTAYAICRRFRCTFHAGLSGRSHFSFFPSTNYSTTLSVVMRHAGATGSASEQRVMSGALLHMNLTGSASGPHG
jgi:predicted MFS family arabinose efflux permease